MKQGICWIIRKPPSPALGADEHRSLALEPPFDRYRPPTKAEVEEAVKTVEAAGLRTTVGRMM